MNASISTILGISHLFSEAKNKHGLWIIFSMCCFEILFESWVTDDCLFWFVAQLHLAAFPFPISRSYFISIDLICLSNDSSACDATTLAFCFSSNNVSDNPELVEDLDDLDELWDFEVLLDFRDL